MSENYTDAVKKRLKTYLTERRLKISTLEKKAGISLGSLRQSNKPSAEFIRLVLEACPDLSAEWLMRGQGNMLLDNGMQPYARELNGNVDNKPYGNTTINNIKLNDNQDDKFSERALLKELLEQKLNDLRSKERILKLMLDHIC